MLLQSKRPRQRRVLLSPGVESTSPSHSYIVTAFAVDASSPRPENAVAIRESGSKSVGVPFKVGSRPGLRGVVAPLLIDLIGIKRLRIVDQCGFY